MTDREDPRFVELHCHSVFSLLDGASEPEALLARAESLGMPALALTDHNDLGGAVRFSQAAREIGVGGIPGTELTLDVDGRMTHLVLLAETAQGYGNISTLITRARMDTARGEPAVTLDTLASHTGGIFALSGCLRGWVPSRVAAGDADAACDAAATLLDLFDGRLAIEVWDHRLPEEREVIGPLIAIARALDIPWVVTNDVHYALPTGRIVHDVLCSIRHQRTLDEMGTRLRPNGEWYLKGFDQMRRRWSHDDAGLRASLTIAERCTFRLEDLKPTLPVFPLPSGVSADEYLARLVDQGAMERIANGRSALPERYRKQIDHELDLIAKLGLAGYFLIVWDIVRFARREGVLCQGRGSAANSVVCFCLGITAIDPVKMELLFERFLSEERPEAPDIDIDFAHRDREKVLQYVYERYGREHAAMVCEHITYRGRSAVRDAARVLGFSVEQADVLSALSDRFSAQLTADALRAQAPATAMLEQYHDFDSRTDKPGSPEDARKQPANWSAEALLGRALPPERPRKQVRIATKEFPKSSAAFEPYGSRNARAAPSSPFLDAYQAGQASSAGSAGTARSGEAKAPDDGVGTVLEQAHLDPKDRRVQVLSDIVSGLHQAPRHRSIHVGGFVLTKEPLRTVVPIEPASMPGRTVIQWERDDLEPAGLVKIDLLGLGMLTVLQDCIKYIRATRGVTIDLGALDMNDQAVFDDLCKADTIGVFQVESRAQMSTLPRLRPRCFYDIVVEVAIIRPGPIQGEMVNPYIRRRLGTEKVEYPHPSLEPVLKRTLGVPLFQEQGMQVAIAAAGFTPGEADVLRRAMGHKRSRERMAAICEKLIGGMLKNGISEDVARRIYNQINAFADYGFPESHAASFALIVYASAYLRHYYPPEFTAAMLNAQPMGFYSPATLIEDGKRHGVKVRPVNLMRSAWDHTLECADGRTVVPHDGVIQVREGGTRSARADAPPVVRLGLRLVRGLGTVAREKLEMALGAGPFADIDDVVRRSGVDQASLRALCEAGAFDAMVRDVPKPERRRTALWRVLDALRGDAGPLAPTPSRVRTNPGSVVPPMSAIEVTDADFRTTGLSLNGHPMKHLRAMLMPNGVRTARDVLERGRNGEKIAHAGLVICRQRPGTAKGFVFLSLEDETGILNVIVTPKRFESQALLISTAPLLLVRGTLQVQDGVVNLKGEEFKQMRADAGEAWSKGHNFH